MKTRELFNLRTDIDYINRVKILGGIFLCGLIILTNIIVVNKSYALFIFFGSSLLMLFGIFLGLYTSTRKEQKIKKMIIKLKGGKTNGKPNRN